MVALQIVLTVWGFGTVLMWIFVVAELINDDNANWKDEKPPFFFATPRHTILCSLIWPVFLLWMLVIHFNDFILNKKEPVRRALRRFVKNKWGAE